MLRSLTQDQERESIMGKKSTVQHVLYYCLPNCRLAVVRDKKGTLVSFANEELAHNIAQFITANESYGLDYPITGKAGFSFDNTTDGVKRAEDDTEQGEVYGYPAGKRPRGLYTL